MNEPSLFWIILVIPGIVKRVLDHNHVKLSQSTWQVLTLFETLGFIAFFMCLGFWLAYQFARNQEKSFDVIQKNYRDDLKNEFKKLHDAHVPMAQENASLKSQVEGLKASMNQMERLIHFLEVTLAEEKNRNTRTPEEANKEALEALS